MGNAYVKHLDSIADDWASASSWEQPALPNTTVATAPQEGNGWKKTKHIRSYCSDIISFVVLCVFNKY